MKSFVITAAAALVAISSVFVPTSSASADALTGNLTLQAPWARASTGGTRPAAAYLTITNKGAADQLTRASSPVAGRVEIHQITKDGDRMRMSEVPAVEVPMHGSVTLEPGGYHVMLMNLKRPLKPGDTFPLTLSFAKTGDVTVTVDVKSAGAAGPDKHSHK